MSILPPALHKTLESRLGIRIDHAHRLGGGMVAHAARVETSGAALFVKWKENAPQGFFHLEADGLSRLAAAGTLSTPKVLAWQDVGVGCEEDLVPFLALEWRQESPQTESVSRKLGEGLAMLHRSPSPFCAFGLETDNFLGSQPQNNSPLSNWPDFYRDRRLLPQIERAKRLGIMPPAREGLLLRLIERLEDILADHEPTPSLIHGDLWIGNALFEANAPCLIDPAVYYADREMEIAFMQLFSGFNQDVFTAYTDAWPLAPEYERRRPLHQLYPLLIHLNHFGEQDYASSIHSVCHFYLDK